MIFKFPFPPSTNTVYVNRKGGRWMTQKGKDYKTELQWTLNSNKPCEGDFAVVINLHPPTAAKRDCGNYEKLICDAMTGYIYHDDSQIKDLRIVMNDKDKEDPRAEVEIKRLIDTNL